MPTPVKFMKMHAHGNDFVVIDGITQNVRLSKQQVTKISDRHFGVGCDQLLILEPPHTSDFDFYCRIYNANGHEVGQCGNGMRCIGRFAKESGLIKQKTFRLATREASMQIEILEHPLVRVNLGIPLLTPNNPITVNFLDQSRSAYLINLGNPHCVFFMPHLDIPLDQWGEALQTHELFPNGINVSVVNCLARNHIKMRVYERGVGETLACGSAACAATVSGILDEQLNSEVQVDLPGGSLTVSWPDKTSGTLLTGPAICVFQGQFMLSHLPAQGQ